MPSSARSGGKGANLAEMARIGLRYHRAHPHHRGVHHYKNGHQYPKSLAK